MGILVGTAAALYVLYSAAVELEVPIPKPAWKPDIQRLEQMLALTEEKLAGLADFTAEEALDANQLRKYNNRRQQEEYIQKNEPVPIWLKDEERLIDQRRRLIERQLRIEEEPSN